MVEKIVFVLCFLCINTLSAQEIAKIYESKIQSDTTTFLEIIKKSNKGYYGFPKENQNNFRVEAKVFNLFNVIDTLDFIEHGVFDDLVLKKGIYAFTITNRLVETFLFVSDDSFTFSTGYCSLLGEAGYNFFNLEEELEKFIQSNPCFIKNEIEKCEIIDRLKNKTYRRITSLR